MTAAPATAQRHAPRQRWDRDRTLHGNLVDVQILVDGKRSDLYGAPDGGARHYFEAVRGRNYAVHLRNRTGRRIGVLVTVDGLNVVNGERSVLASHEPMYVLDPWETATLRGWRTSLADVRQFVFVDEERSYANRTDQANGDMGWIRVLAFAEEPPVTWYAPDRFGRDEEASGEVESRRDAAPQAGKSKPSTLDRDVQAPRSEAVPGTGWGGKRHDPVRRVWFDPAATASDHLVLRYEYASGLYALGIFRDGGRHRDRLSERENGEVGFARRPRW